MVTLEDFEGKKCVLEIYPPKGHVRSEPQIFTGMVLRDSCSKEYSFLPTGKPRIPLTSKGRSLVSYVEEFGGVRTVAIQLEYDCLK